MAWSSRVSAHVRLRLLARLMHGEARLLIVLILLAALPLAAVTLVDSLRHSSEYAYAESARGSNAGFDWALAPNTQAQSQKLEKAGLVPIGATPGLLRYKESALASVVYETSADVVLDQYGTTVSPRTVGVEGPGVALSAEAASRLGAGVGDHVHLEAAGLKGEAVVVRIYVIPMQPALVTAVASISTPPTLATSSLRWLATDRQFHDPAVVAVFDADHTIGIGSSRGYSVADNDLLEAARLARLGFVGPIGVAVVLALWGGAVSLTGDRWARHRAALEAAGMRRSVTHDLVLSALAAALCAGVALGVLIGVGLTLTAFGYFGRLSDQWWTRGVVSASSLAPIVAAVIGGGIVITSLRLRRRARARARSARSTRLATVVGLGAGVLGVLLLWVGSSPDETMGIVYGLVVSLIFAAALPSIVVGLASLGVRRGSARSRAAVSVVSSSSLGAIAVCLICALGAYPAALLTNDVAAMQEANRTLAQPIGSVVVNQADGRTRELVENAWASGNGRARVTAYALPVDTPDHQVRVTTPESARCLSKHRRQRVDVADMACRLASGSGAPLTSISLADGDVPGREVHATEPFVSLGMVGIVVIHGGRIVRVGTEPASVDPTLGGQLPGAAVAAEGAVATTWELEQSDRARLLLETEPADVGYAERMAPVIALLSPTAQLSVGRGFDDGGEGLWAVFVAIVASGVALFVSLGLLSLIARSFTPLRARLTEHGVLARRRASVAIASLSLIVVGPLWACVVAFLLARHFGVSGMPFGNAMWLPAGVCAVAWLIGLAAFTRVPRPPR